MDSKLDARKLMKRKQNRKKIIILLSYPTMAQASTLVHVTKMKKAQAWTLALSWDYC